MQCPLRALLVLTALLAIILVDPTSAECKVRAGSSSSAAVPAAEAGLAPVHAANATANTTTSEVGSDANFGSEAAVSSSSNNKIQNAPKKRMKNKILFDVTKPAKSSTSTNNNNNNSPGGSTGATSQQSSS